MSEIIIRFLLSLSKVYCKLHRYHLKETKEVTNDFIIWCILSLYINKELSEFLALYLSRINHILRRSLSLLFELEITSMKKGEFGLIHRKNIN